MIRNATTDDIPRIVEMGWNLHDSTSYRHVAYSEDRVTKTAETMIAHGFCVVVEKDGNLVGAMMGDVYTPWYSTDKLGIDYTLWIEPGHRNGLIAAKMVKRFEDWCVGMGAKQIRPGIGTCDQGMMRLYEKLGYKSQGAWFLKNIN